jgi:hypothetical protein
LTVPLPSKSPGIVVVPPVVKTTLFPAMLNVNAERSLGCSARPAALSAPVEVSTV